MKTELSFEDAAQSSLGFDDNVERDPLSTVLELEVKHESPEYQSLDVAENQRNDVSLQERARFARAWHDQCEVGADTLQPGVSIGSLLSCQYQTLSVQALPVVNKTVDVTSLKADITEETRCKTTLVNRQNLSAKFHVGKLVKGGSAKAGIIEKTKQALAIKLHMKKCVDVVVANADITKKTERALPIKLYLKEPVNVDGANADITKTTTQASSIKLVLEESTVVGGNKVDVTRASTFKRDLTNTRSADLCGQERKTTEQLVESFNVVVDDPSCRQNAVPDIWNLNAAFDVDLYWKKRKSKFTCKLCNRTWANLGRCRGHIRDHVGLRPYVCTQEKCAKTFSSKINLQRHVSSFHENRDRFKCEFCGRTFSRRSRFTTHWEKHKGIPAIPFRKYDCADCGKTFTTKTCVLKHIVGIHNGDSTHKQCDVCGKVFRTIENFRSHCRSHKEKRFKCNVCGTRFHFAGLLSTHMGVHSTERPFQCDICSKTFHLKAAVSRHIRLSHQRRQAYECPKCEKSFRSREFWKEHVLKHDGVRKYSCDTCGKTFAQSSHLAAHRFSHGEKKFVCSVCGAKFNRNDNMKSHLKRHDRPTKKCPIK